MAVASNVLELIELGEPGYDQPLSVRAGCRGRGRWRSTATAMHGLRTNGATITKLSANGAGLSPSAGWATGGVSGASALALGYAGNVWVADSGGNDITVLSNNGVPIPGSPYLGGGLDGPYALAIDSTGGAWVANLNGSSLSRFSNSGAAIAGSPFYGGGLNAPIGLALGWAGECVAGELGQQQRVAVPELGTAAVGGGWICERSTVEPFPPGDRPVRKRVGGEPWRQLNFYGNDHADCGGGRLQW